MNKELHFDGLNTVYHMKNECNAHNEDVIKYAWVMFLIIAVSISDMQRIDSALLYNIRTAQYHVW